MCRGLSMPNITLSMDKKLIKKSREYAQKHGKSLNALVRELLQNTVNANVSANTLDEFLNMMDKAAGNSKGKKWSRKDIYDRKVLC